MIEVRIERRYTIRYQLIRKTYYTNSYYNSILQYYFTTYHFLLPFISHFLKYRSWGGLRSENTARLKLREPKFPLIFISSMVAENTQLVHAVWWYIFSLKDRCQRKTTACIIVYTDCLACLKCRRHPVPSRILTIGIVTFLNKSHILHLHWYGDYECY